MACLATCGDSSLALGAGLQYRALIQCGAHVSCVGLAPMMATSGVVMNVEVMPDVLK